MKKLEVGDTVVFRDDLVVGRDYGGFHLYEPMFDAIDFNGSITVYKEELETFYIYKDSFCYPYEMLDWGKTIAINKHLKDNRKYIVKTSEDSGLIFDEISKCVYISDFYCLEDCRIELTEDEIKNSAHPYLWKIAELVEEEDNA